MTKTNGEGFLYTTLKDQLIYEKMLQTSDDKLLTQSQLSVPKSKFKDYGY